MRVVLDSKVLVAGLRSRRGASFRLLELLRDGVFEIAVSVPLALEYEAVLLRHARDIELSGREIEGVVDYLCQIAHRQDIHFLWRPTLSDPKDEFVLELAVGAECEWIVTHNIRDFRKATRFRLKVVRPADFLNILEERP